MSLRLTNPLRQPLFFLVATWLSPNMPYLRNEWSQTLVQMGDWDGTCAQLDESLRLDPKYAQSYFYYGEYYRSQQGFALAAENLLRAIPLARRHWQMAMANCWRVR